MVKRGVPFEVIQALVEEGGMHRAELARHLGTSRATITNTVTALLDQGVVEPDHGGSGPDPADGRATLKEKIVLSRHAGIVGAVIHQDDSTIVGLGTPDGRVLGARSIPGHPTAGGRERIDGATLALEELLGDLPTPRPPLLGLHVSPNTLLDRHSGEVLGGAASSAWSGLNIRREYEQRFGTAVVLENIARHAAYAQYGALPEPHPRNLLHVSLSFGIALGQVLDGRIISGAHGGAGELGHVVIDSNGPACPCSNRGCLMRYASAEHVLEDCRTVAGTDLTLDDAIDLALAGDERIVAIFSRAGTAVGVSLNAACNLLDPDLILIGGRLARAGDAILTPLRDALFRSALPLFGHGLRVERAADLSPHQLLHASFRALRLDLDLPTAVLAGQNSRRDTHLA